MDENLKREIIMEHYTNPMNKEEFSNDEYIKINTNNASCIDNLDIYILFDKDIIKDIRFNGEACAISTSSTSIMIKNLIGMNVKEALEYVNNFENMVNEKAYDSELLKEANAYDTIYKQNSRKTCALLPYTGIKKVLESFSLH